MKATKIYNFKFVTAEGTYEFTARTLRSAKAKASKLANYETGTLYVSHPENAAGEWMPVSAKVFKSNSAKIKWHDWSWAYLSAIFPSEEK